MKRSEMIHIIEDFLWKSNGDYGYKKLAKQDAEDLLKRLEQAGMKPKGYYALACTGEKYDENNVGHGYRLIEYYHTWEPEDG